MPNMKEMFNDFMDKVFRVHDDYDYELESFPENSHEYDNSQTFHQKKSDKRNGLSKNGPSTVPNFVVDQMQNMNYSPMYQQNQFPNQMNAPFSNQFNNQQFAMNNGAPQMNQFPQQPFPMQQDQGQFNPNLNMKNQVNQQPSPFMQSLGQTSIPNYVQQQNSSDLSQLNNMQMHQQVAQNNSYSQQDNSVNLAKLDSLQMFSPKEFSEVEEIGNLLKEGGTALVNLEGVQYDLAMRILDFLAGMSFARNVSPREVQNDVYIFSFTQSLEQGFKPFEDIQNKKPSIPNSYNDRNPFSV